MAHRSGGGLAEEPIEDQPPQLGPLAQQGVAGAVRQGIPRAPPRASADLVDQLHQHMGVAVGSAHQQIHVRIRQPRQASGHQRGQGPIGPQTHLRPRPPGGDDRSEVGGEARPRGVPPPRDVAVGGHQQQGPARRHGTIPQLGEELQGPGVAGSGGEVGVVADHHGGQRGQTVPGPQQLAEVGQGLLEQIRLAVADEVGGGGLGGLGHRLAVIGAGGAQPSRCRDPLPQHRQPGPHRPQQRLDPLAQQGSDLIPAEIPHAIGGVGHPAGEQDRGEVGQQPAS